MNPPKFCKDCKFHSVRSDNAPECRHENFSGKYDLVTGERSYVLCHLAREDVLSNCGIEAKLFEPKPETIQLRTWTQQKSGNSGGFNTECQHLVTVSMLKGIVGAGAYAEVHCAQCGKYMPSGYSPFDHHLMHRNKTNPKI